MIHLPDDLSPLARQMLHGLTNAPRPRLEPQDWRGLRRRVEDDAAMLLQLWQQMGVSFDTLELELAGVPCVEIQPPRLRRRDALVLYLHGGGFVCGSAKTLLGLPHAVAAACGLRVLSIDYRLAPEHPFPAAIDDTVAVYGALLRDGIANTDIAWLGDSTGGGLALAAVQVIATQGSAGPAAMALLSPWLDLTLGGDSCHAFGAVDPFFDVETLRAWGRLYSAQASLGDPLLSPLFGSMEGLPPILVQSGSKDILLSDSWRLARRIRQLDGPVELDLWDGMWHVFQATPGLPEAEQAIGRIGGFLQRHIP